MAKNVGWNVEEENNICKDDEDEQSSNDIVKKKGEDDKDGDTTTINVSWVVHEEPEVLISKIIDEEKQECHSGTNKIAIDTACPNSMTSEDTLNIYLKENGLSLESLEKELITKRFRFGPSKVYMSNMIVTLPLKIKLENEEF
jgi:hypothetical protein